jgi:predicted ribosomally synthesized peptide with nif11-like leader
MSIKDIVGFYKIVERDADLRSKLVRGDATDFREAAVELGRQHGFQFTEEELDAVVTSQPGKEDVWITDEELDRMGPGDHPCLPSGTGALELLSLAMKVREAGRSGK